MKTNNVISSKEQLVLDFIQKAKSRYKAQCFKYIPIRDYVVQTEFTKLKTELLYSDKRYILLKERYENQQIPMEIFKYETNSIWNDILSVFNHPDINKFFNLKTNKLRIYKI
ncbi:MAG: hypothetical protein LC105_04730 [Chitinophagales bacterium]|nr:hypothetical protein [Chitinophagales bacterium]MCZ2393143.1 hypothetical protein [Chitinophagales bacterium]